MPGPSVSASTRPNGADDADPTSGVAGDSVEGGPFEGGHLVAFIIPSHFPRPSSPTGIDSPIIEAKGSRRSPWEHHRRVGIDLDGDDQGGQVAHRHHYADHPPAD